MTGPDLGAMGLEEARRLLAPALFDAALYRREAGLAEGDDAFAHYFALGARARLRPNVAFDADWYVARNPQAAANPLLHYAVIGEPAGRDPGPQFDVAWYRRTYAAARPLAHYLAHRFGPFSPCPEFDAVFYLQTYPDVAAAGLDPFLHYLHFGFREFRAPSAGFDARRYARRFLRGQPGVNPLVHRRAHPDAAPTPPRADPHDETRRFGRRGPRYEPLAPAAAAPPRALVLAFHLPQFHAIAENDAWWGEGYTEWTRLALGQPRFAGHYQPRIPGSLGFYDLSDIEALRRQARLAREAGIGAFVFYHYDFDGRRLLEKPVEQFLATPDVDMPFCLMWANENWTRRWDGADDDVLIGQSYDERREAARVADFVRHFRDSRYLRLQGRPLLMIYRAGLIPDTAATLARWRRLFAAAGETPILIMAQTFDDLDPRPLGFDAAIEFPPHKLTKGLPQVYDALDIFDENFETDVFAYADLVDASLAQAQPPFPLIQTAVPSWDNDARRQGRGLTLVGSTPREYERWLSALIDRAPPLWGQRLVAINAWNEWSEGAYLEPDVHFGAAYLNATARAVRGPPEAKASAWGSRLAAAFGAVPEGAPASPPPADADEADAQARALFASLWPDRAKVSAFVLHAGGPFDVARLRSLFAQTHPVWEIFVLDAGETSAQAVAAQARAARRDLTLVLDVADFARRAVDLASGDFVWLMNAPGRSDPTALAALSRALRAEPGAAFAFCESGPANAPARPTPLSPRQRFGFTDKLCDAAELLTDAPALSAILWRREALAAAAGERVDGLLRAAASAPGARAAFVAERLDFAAPG